MSPMDGLPAIEDQGYEEKVLRSFVHAGRLVRIPARERKKRVVLRWLVERVFPDTEPVDERDLNERLASWNPDVSSLRRYLVEVGLVSRTGMTYRRVAPSPEGPDPEDVPPLV